MSLPDLQGKPKRAFVQTFFLAVQEKGYFVLNDLFRYVPEAAQSAPEPEAHTAPPPFAPIENGYSQPAVPSHVPYPTQVAPSAYLLLQLVDHSQDEHALRAYLALACLAAAVPGPLVPLRGCVEVA